MANNTQIEQLDKIVSALLGPPDAPLSRTDAGRPFDTSFAPTIEVIRDLKDLPRPDFKARLKADLERRITVASTAAKPVREGFHTVTPYLIIPNASQWIDFVTKAFGAEERFRANRPGAEDVIMHAEVKIGDSMVEAADANPQYPAMPAAIWLRVEDVDAAYQRAIDAGATSIHPPADQDYGSRDGSVKDASGNSWYIFTPKAGNEMFEGLRSVAPYMHPLRSGEVIEFLQKAFGAEEVYRAQSPEGAVYHAQVRIGDSIIGMGDAHGIYQAMPSTLHLYVPDTDEVYQQALGAGAVSIQPPADQPYGDRSAGVTDPFGNRWFIATHIKDVAF